MGLDLNFTNNVASVYVTGTIGGIQSVDMPKGSYQVVRVSPTMLHLQPLNGAYDIGQFKFADVLTPVTADIDALEVALRGFFNVVSTTYTVLLADLQNGLAPAGEWVKVEDILDRGAYLFCASSTEVAKEGFGLFLNEDEQNIGTYLTSYSGYPCSQTNYGQWRPTVGNFLINIGAITGGPYTAGEPITTATWAGIFVEYDGIGVMTAYSTGGNTYPLAGETITGGTSGATSVQSGTAGLNQLTGGGVVIFQENNFLKYEHYLAIDPAHIDGSQTPDKDPAYLRLDRSVASAGYIPVVDAITYDINGNDAWTLNGWLIGRKNASHDIRLTEATSNVFLIDSSRIHTYPWGSDTVKGFRIDDGRFVAYNIGDLDIENVYIGQGSQHAATLAARSSITNFTQDAGTTVEYTLEASVSISNVRVKSGRTFTSKTFTADVGDMLVSADNTTGESLTYAPFTKYGQWQIVFDISSAQLLNHLNVGGINGDPDRIPLLALSGTQYATGTIRYEFTYATAPYTLTGHPCIYNTTGNILSKGNGTTITGSTDRGCVDTLNIPIAGQSVSFEFGESHWLGTTSSQNAAGGGGTLKIIYNIDIHEKMV
jgi:hypothetical protein